MQELRRSSQQTQPVAQWQSPKVVLPRLPNKKAGSLPSYSNLKAGGGDYSRARNESTFSQDNELEVIRTVDCPKVSARAWLVYNRQADLVIKSYAARSRRQIASLTKLMSAFCTVELCERYNMPLKQTYFRVTETAVDEEIKSIDLTEDEDHVDLYVNHFLEYMNSAAKRMSLRNTKFTNPHGLDYRNNYSCCEDLLRLTLQCFENEVSIELAQYLQKICSTKQHKAEVRIYRNKVMYRKGITWQNTNKLLGNGGCRGFKTGYTPKAGGCLSSIFQTNMPTGPATFVVIVLGSKSQDHRFFDTSRLVEYASEELRYLLK